MEAESQDGGYCHGQTGFLEPGTVRTALRQVTETEVTDRRYHGMDWVWGKGKETNPGHLVFWPQQLRGC